MGTRVGPVYAKYEVLWVEDYLKEKLWLASIQAKILKSVATLKENLLQRH